MYSAALGIAVAGAVHQSVFLMSRKTVPIRFERRLAITSRYFDFITTDF